ncbi:MAG: Tryptophan synthase alpha chain [Labilithrix sp.]|nr:Tryptophan synthase alpha chain [Labilithrix sp.]
MRSIPLSVRLAAVWFVVVALVVACGSGQESTFQPAPVIDEDAGVGSSGSPGFMPGAAEGGVPTNPNCKPLTCADQKIECGPAGDGCGGLIAECGKCAAGLRCGGPNALSKCVSPSIGTGCVPKTCTDLGVQCGLAGDGCGGTLTCGTCPSGEQCGVTGKPSQCVAATPASADGGACIKKTCADYLLENKDCGTQSDGCGGTVDCGVCTGASEFCGGGGPSKCAVSGGGVCTPKTCADFTGKCGPQQDGCGGVTTDCGGCTLPEICGGGGTPSVCGGGTLLADGGGGACVPRTVCGATECGQVADGCGGVLDCGIASCVAGTTCGGSKIANQCGSPACVPLVACPIGKNCGSIADGCGGTVSCGGACAAPAICGGGGTPNVCGGGTITGPGGGACVPIKVCPANACGLIADGCGGSLTCGGCISPALCGGGGTPSVCGGGNQCTPKTKAAACGTMNCGYAADGCGGFFVCGLNNLPDCPTGQSCGLYSPNQCGSLTGPCIATGAVTTCTQNSDCCSGSCGATGKCLATACKNLAVACANGNECCSGKCTGGVCAATNGGSCKASGSTCAANTECCSGGCMGGTCSAATSFCRQNGDACTSSTQCCGGTCTGATATQAGYCSTVIAPGGGTSCTIAGTVVACSSSTDYACNAACCSGSCGPNDAAPGFQICQQGASCKVQGELCTKSDDCCGYPTMGSLQCSKPAGASATDYGRCNSENSCSKPGQVCKTIADACSFPNNCCEPGDIALAGGGNCNSNPDACCRHDNNGIPRCTQYAVCRAAGQTCESPADCCPINGVTPPCSPDAGGVYHCAASCLADNATCTIDKDCCGGNCYKATAGAATGTCKIPTCTKLTCAAYPGKCGQLSDGCGGIALAADGVTPDCGGCTFPQTCGGGGTPNVCGGQICTPNTCAGLNAECGTVPNGCGQLLTCPDCTVGTCGGGGVANKCGTPTCNALTCAGQGIECGQTGDGCGNVLDCPPCGPNTTCGGGGVANKCGAPACTPLTKCPAGKTCGDYPDGCGGSVHCGECVPGETCGGGGAVNVCGKASCVAKNCAQQGAQCGTISDQCGGVVTCPLCGADQFCNGQNLCVGLACTAKTCIQLNVQCGPTADGCGGLVPCGNCPAGQGCGAGGVPGQCGTQPCAPKTCAELGAVCGKVANGCGGLTADCGTCAGALSCKNGACVNACTPRTCASIGAQCGAIADGCGGIVQCGPCPDGETCGYNNIANKCGKDMPK